MSDTSKLSHEINNYLSVILSQMQNIEEKYNALSTDKSWAAMKQDTCQLARFVGSHILSSDENTLVAASTEMLEEKQTSEIFSIHTLLQSLTHSWKLRYSRRGFRLTYINQHQDSLKMMGTPYEVVQIFNNLLSNSYDALALKQQDSENISHNWFPEATLILACFKDQIIIKLEDNGCGIPESKLPHIFDYGITTKESGHGIGLSVVKELVEKHHGHIYVRSLEQDGCDFHLIFPAFSIE
ncbi:MAG: HAMP domain-containing sensor histidine kinase [Lachnospiraceae bacterium]|nr:HAMP domain-containing sensor histidine kinase [Lachnospiraceae bacterium]